jgi:hypothetical protein
VALRNNPNIKTMMIATTNNNNNNTTARMDAEEEPTERQWSVVEAAANESLDVIQQVVDMLKHHFTVLTAVTVNNKNNSRSKRDDDDDKEPPPPRGREELPMENVEKLQWQARHCWDSTRAALRLLPPGAGDNEDAGTEVMTLLAWAENTTSREDSTPSCAEDVLGSTLLMLMLSLWQSYEVLDRLPSTAPPPPPLSKNEEPAGQHNNNNHKPRAPWGLLSLRHYTEIHRLLDYPPHNAELYLTTHSGSDSSYLAQDHCRTSTERCTGLGGGDDGQW